MPLLVGGFINFIVIRSAHSPVLVLAYLQLHIVPELLLILPHKMVEELNTDILAMRHGKHSGHHTPTATADSRLKLNQGIQLMEISDKVGESRQPMAPR